MNTWFGPNAGVNGPLPGGVTTVNGAEPGHVTSNVRPFFGAASALVTPRSIAAPEGATTVATARFLVARPAGRPSEICHGNDERLADALVPEPLVDGEFIQKHLGALVGMSHLDPSQSRPPFLVRTRPACDGRAQRETDGSMTPLLRRLSLDPPMGVV